jgi:hypothetical protein
LDYKNSKEKKQKKKENMPIPMCWTLMSRGGAEKSFKKYSPKEEDFLKVFLALLI